MAEKAEATVVFGVLNETSEHESRVALTPDIVTRLRKSGVNCLIESGAASHRIMLMRIIVRPERRSSPPMK